MPDKMERQKLPVAGYVLKTIPSPSFVAKSPLALRPSRYGAQGSQWFNELVSLAGTICRMNVLHHEAERRDPDAMQKARGLWRVVDPRITEDMFDRMKELANEIRALRFEKASIVSVEAQRAIRQRIHQHSLQQRVADDAVRIGLATDHPFQR